MDIEELKDRIALKELVDRISMLADKKDFAAQVQLFTEDAACETVANGIKVLNLQGREEMATAFNNYLKNVSTLFHFNGQHIVNVNGSNATGTSYCVITMIHAEDNNGTTTTIRAIYSDDYVRVNNKWLISKRIGNFVTEEIGN